MLKRTIYIGTPSYLKLKDSQIKIEDVTKEIKGSVSIEDMVFLILDHYQITMTHQLILAL